MIAPRTQRRLLAACGLLCVGLAGIAWILPVVPTTPFLLLAAWCFVRSSPRLHRWLFGNRLFGPYLRDYEAGRGLPWTLKALILVWIWGLAVFSATFIARETWMRVLIAATTLGTTWYFLRLPTRRR